MSIEECEYALAQAQKRERVLLRQIREEEDKAKRAIAIRYQAQMKKVLTAINAAHKALQVAKDETPDHPWTGKRVFKVEPVGSPWNRKKKRVEGIVETRRSDTPLPANVTWRRPNVGEGFVRLLKKDGSPSLRFEVLWSDWRLVEAEQ